MSATIRVHGALSTIDGGEWTSEIDEVAAMLNAERDPVGPSGADPDPDGNEARRMAELFDGELISRDKVPYNKDEVY